VALVESPGQNSYTGCFSDRAQKQWEEGLSGIEVALERISTISREGAGRRADEKLSGLVPSSLQGKHQLFALVKFSRALGFLTSNSWCVVEKLKAGNVGRVPFHINVVEICKI
jgi:hypothetical protein